MGIFGPNGAGKTTLLKCILGLLRYGFGSVTLDGQPITPKNIARLSYATCEHSFFPGLTAAGHRDFCAEHFPAFRAGRFQMLMDFFRLPEKRAAPVRCLAGRGVARITRAGTMSHTLRGEAHGGEYPLHRYVRWDKKGE